MEIPIEVTVEMEDTEDNCVAMKEYEASVTLKYKEPVQGEYEDDTTSILAIHIQWFRYHKSWRPL